MGLWASSISRHSPNIIQHLLQCRLALVSLGIPLEAAISPSHLTAAALQLDEEQEGAHLGISATATSTVSGRRYMICEISNLFKKPGFAINALQVRMPLGIDERSHRVNNLGRGVGELVHVFLC